MNIYKKAETGTATIISLIQEIKQKELVKYTKQEIEQQRVAFERLSIQNRKTKAFISRVEKNIKSGKYGDSYALSMLDAIDDLRAGKSVAFRKGKKETVYKPIMDISYMRNTLNKMEGKDFFYRVNDGFSRYKIKRSEVLKMEDNSFFINKLKSGVEEAIERTLKSTHLTEAQKNKKVEILRDNLLKVIEYNSLVDSKGKEDIRLLKPEFRKEVNLFFNEKIEKNEKNGKYPITVKIYGNESIEI